MKKSMTVITVPLLTSSAILPPFFFPYVKGEFLSTVLCAKGGYV